MLGPQREGKGAGLPKRKNSRNFIISEGNETRCPAPGRGGKKGGEVKGKIRGKERRDGSSTKCFQRKDVQEERKK